MRALARLLTKKLFAGAIVAGVVVASLLALWFAGRVEQDDDVLAFLPRGDADVTAFQAINARFGGLDVGLVGVETDDVFARGFLERLGRVTAQLGETDGVGSALSLSNVESFLPDAQGGIRLDYLVGALPATPAESQALRERVLARDEVVGQFVDQAGRGVVIYVFHAHGADPRATAARVRAVVDAGFPDEVKHWGGAPFISSYIYDVTQRDLRRLAPFAVLVLVLITIASFRNLLGSALALLSTGLAIVLTQGLMGALAVRSNIVLGSMPIILFALGSAYSIHFLARYYALVGEHGVEEAVGRVLAELGPTIIATGLTTVAGLLSVVVMDIAPMRSFGLFTAIGLLVALGLALTFVPAVLVLARLDGRMPSQVSSRILGALSGAVTRRRRLVAIALGCVAVAAVPLAFAVDSRMDERAFFGDDSPPARAQRFLTERFGGSTFLQLEVDGDLTDPRVLARVAELGDRAAVVPGVAGVMHIGEVLALTNQALSGEGILPDTAAKARLLYGFLEGKRAIRQLVTEDRRHALIQVKLRSSAPGDTEPVLEAVRELVAAAPASPRAATVARIHALVAREHGPLPPAALAALDARLAAPERPRPAAAVERALAAYLASDEFLGELPAAGADAVAAAAVRIGPGAPRDQLAAALAPLSESAEQLADDVAGPLAEVWRRETAFAWARQLGLPVAGGIRGERMLEQVGFALLALDRGPPPAILAPVQVSGLPVMHAGLSRSVARNQVRSILFALFAVTAITVLLYRSLWSGLLALLPTAFTVAVMYAVMTLTGVRLDLGTSLLASLIIGAGVDYAIHTMAAWEAPAGAPLAEAAQRASATAGLSVWLNALMVAAGFFVLTLGEARALQNVGGLTAAAMLVSALATFLIIPALARKHRYRRLAADAAEPATGVAMSPRRSP